ncbi:hypothetical protein E4T39_07977 [Aureobasidium subglaciale]|nr:hypothetical protein E4T39_07977 [Aureobasidium subglaciale]
MYSSLSFLVAALSLSSTAIAFPHQKRLAEKEPWHLTNISVFTSSNDLRNSSISFNLVDNNAGLTANTTCSRSTPGSVEDGNNFYPCTDKSFNFRWDGRTLRLQRHYIDTNVGPCPLYCTVTAYGNADPELAVDYIGEDGKGDMSIATFDIVDTDVL